MTRTLKIFISFFFLSTGILNAQALKVNTDLVYKVNLPQKKADKVPVIILLHGYGSNEDDLFSISKSFDSRFLTFSIRGPQNAKGGQGYSWYTLDWLPENKMQHNYSEAQKSREKILSFISNACRVYKADSTQVFIIGFSQGAIMAYDIAISKPEKIKGIMALSGKMLGETKSIKANDAKVSKVKFFIGHGNMDNVIDFGEGEAAAKYLQEKKAGVSFKSYNMPHSLNGEELNDIKAWLASNLDKEKSASGKK